LAEFKLQVGDLFNLKDLKNKKAKLNEVKYWPIFPQAM